MSDRPLSRRGMTICEDWCAWLPEPKSRLNHSCSKELETLYVMLSISLDEALDLHRKGAVGKSMEGARIAGGLCARFSESLALVLREMNRQAKHHGLIPNA